MRGVNAEIEMFGFGDLPEKAGLRWYRSSKRPFVSLFHPRIEQCFNPMTYCGVVHESLVAEFFRSSASQNIELNSGNQYTLQISSLGHNIRAVVQRRILHLSLWNAHVNVTCTTRLIARRAYCVGESSKFMCVSVRASESDRSFDRALFGALSEQ